MSNSPIDSLLSIMRALRDPEHGCPWDLKQTYQSIIPHTLEETYEVIDAIERKDFVNLKEELGDLLLQIVLYSQIAKEEGRFDFSDVVENLNQKMIRRHPHVFNQDQTDQALTEEEVLVNWEKIKQAEKQALIEQEKLNQAQINQDNETQNKQVESILDSIPQSFPALMRAYKLQKKCAQYGFDWQEIEPVLAKVHEEINEVMDEVNHSVPSFDRIEDELGDLLFSVVNLVRHLKHHPEAALNRANAKFERRFRMVEQNILNQNKKLADCSLTELDLEWDKAKVLEKATVLESSEVLEKSKAFENANDEGKE